MITIIYDEKGKDMSLQASGHAGYAPKGQDIVCAAVSTLMQSLAYSVDSGTVTCDPGGDNILRVQASQSLDTLAKFELVMDGLYLLAQHTGIDGAAGRCHTADGGFLTHPGRRDGRGVHRCLGDPGDSGIPGGGGLRTGDGDGDALIALGEYKLILAV